MCATVDSQCLEYLKYITLPLTCLFEINIAARNESFFQVFQSCFLRERTYQKQFVIFYLFTHCKSHDYPINQSQIKVGTPPLPNTLYPLMTRLYAGK